ncbi:hypothetical protein PGB90_006205 [Kerria lacca]
MNFEPNTCEKEYAKDPEIKQEDIQQLLDWAEKQQHMPKITEYQTIQFYHATNYSIQKTKNLMEIHYAYKNEAPEFYTGKDFDKPRYQHNFWDVAYCFDLPMSTPEGYRIVYCGLKDFDPAKYNYEIITAMFTKIMLTIIMEQGLCCGYAFIHDLQGFSFSHLSSVSISLIRKFLYISQETLQLKVRQIHIINGRSIIEKIMMLTKPFLKKELFDMIHIQSDINKFQESFGKERLPLDVGGTLPFTRDELNEKMKAKVDAFADITQKELDLRSDVTKINGDKENNFTSTNGSFKKLVID